MRYANKKAIKMSSTTLPSIKDIRQPHPMRLAVLNGLFTAARVLTYFP